MICSNGRLGAAKVSSRAPIKQPKPATRTEQHKGESNAALALFASCPRGLETVLARELERIGAVAPQVTGAGVVFDGDARLAMTVNLRSRIASRVLLRVAVARYRDEDGLYKLARQTEWENWFDERSTLRVDVAAQRSPLRSLNFAALRVKDAICDRFRQASGVRPSVDTRDPDVRVFVFLGVNEASLYLDLSGESLFKRGWRSGEDAKGAAPLKENLAAGLLALAGWQPGMPLHDPYCGSGTILIEAAQQTLGCAPGLARGFGFERLQGFDPLVFADLRQAARDEAVSAVARYNRAGQNAFLSGADIDPQAIARARRNLARAGIPEGMVSLSVADITSPRLRRPAPRPAPVADISTADVTAADVLPAGVPLARAPAADVPAADRPARSSASTTRGQLSTPRGLIVSNPPYGERMEAISGDDGSLAHAGPPPTWVAPDDSHFQAMRAAGTSLRRTFGGWRVCLLSPDGDLPKQLGMQPRRKTPLFNGAIECRLYCFDIFERAQG